MNETTIVEMLDGTTDNLLIEFASNLIDTNRIFEKLNVPKEKQEAVSIKLHSFVREWEKTEDSGKGEDDRDTLLKNYSTSIARIIA